MTPRAVVLVLACVSACVGHCAARYWGASLGPLSRLQHGVSGHVYAVDARTLYIKDFHYDGQGPAAYFIVGTTATPSTGGTRLRDERGGAGPLRAYRGEGVTLSLPEGKTLKDFRYLSVWCEEYSVNFGHVSIPAAAEGPRAARLGALRGVHGVRSDPVLVVDAQTILVPNFSYDGEAPDAKFWVGRGPKPSPQGVRIPDENGKEAPLRKYDRKTIVLTLPGELTVFDIGHFGVWCEAFTVDFGHVEIPAALVANVPPSLKMLGVSPQSRNKALSSGGGSSAATSPAHSPAAAKSRPKSRPSLRATTYRPPLASLLDHGTAQHDHLTRRHDINSQPQQQTLQTPEHHQLYQVHQQPQPEQQQLYQQNRYEPQHVQLPSPVYYQPHQLAALDQQQLLQQQQLFDRQIQLYRLLLERQSRNERHQFGPEHYTLGSGPRDGVTVQRSIDLDPLGEP